MTTSNISREQFIHTLTVPWADPLELLPYGHKPEARITAWEESGVAMRFAGNALATAGVRLATPAITGFGLGKNWVDKHPTLAVAAPAAAVGGAVVGTVVGATGVVINLGMAAFGAACGVAYATQAGLDAWRPSEPTRS